MAAVLRGFVDLIFFLIAEEEGEGGRAAPHLHAAHSLFPSVLCSSVMQIVACLDDAAVSSDGCAVYEVAYQVIETIFQYSFYCVRRNLIIGRTLLILGPIRQKGSEVPNTYLGIIYVLLDFF